MYLTKYQIEDLNRLSETNNKKAQKRRDKFAMAALTGLLAAGCTEIAAMAEDAVAMADAVITELDKETE